MTHNCHVYQFCYSKQGSTTSSKDGDRSEGLPPNSVEDRPGSAAEDEHNSSLVEGGEGDDPLEWLEGIGLKKSHFPSLRASKTQM